MNQKEKLAITRDFPSPIVWAWSKVVSENESYRTRVFNIFNCIEAVLSFIGAVSVMDYLKADPKSRNINKFILDQSVTLLSVAGLVFLK